MDPKACLDACEAAIENGDAGEAEDRLADYRAWRRKGGFEPAHGDQRAGNLYERILAMPCGDENEDGSRDLDDEEDDLTGNEHFPCEECGSTSGRPDNVCPDCGTFNHN